MTLKNIFKKYKTDKISHKYHLIYEKYFSEIKDKKLNILEIGVADGSSLLAWSKYFKNSKIIGIDIKKISSKIKLPKNVFFYQGSQSDKSFLDKLINIHKKFDIIIDDGSHHPADVIFSFKNMFNSLSLKGLYFVEDMQTSYNHFFGGNPFDLNYANTHMNYFKRLADNINYKEIANPFYVKKKYDGLIKSVSFYNNLVVVEKDINNIDSNLVLNNSYENKRYNTKIKRKNEKIRYFIKYKILFKLYTLLFFIFNLIKKIILLRF